MTQIITYIIEQKYELTETDGTYAIQDSFVKEGDPGYTDSVDISTNNANLRTITIARNRRFIQPRRLSHNKYCISCKWSAKYLA